MNKGIASATNSTIALPDSDFKVFVNPQLFLERILYKNSGVNLSFVVNALAFVINRLEVFIASGINWLNNRDSDHIRNRVAAHKDG